MDSPSAKQRSSARGFLWRTTVLLIAISAVVVGCTAPSVATTQPPDAMSSAQAIEIAMSLAHSAEAPTVVSAVAGPFSKFSGGAHLTTVTGDPWVWSIVLEGSFRSDCSAAASPPSSASSPSCTPFVMPRERVVIDAVSGATLLAASGY